MMRHFESLVLLCSVYLLTVFLGLNTAAFIIPMMYPPPGVEPTIEPVLGDPNSLWSTLYLLVYMLVATAVLLFLMRKGVYWIINASLTLSFFAGMFYTFSAFVGLDFGLLLSLATVAVYIMRRDDVVLSNIVLLLTLPGIGAILGASIGIIPVIALLIFASVYDYYAVFISKHMVALARGSKGRLNMMFLVPVGDRVMGLGAGDIALPTTFAVSVYAANGIGYAIPTAFGGVLGLVSLFYYLLDRRGVTLPALPPIVGGLLIGYGLCLLLLP